MLLLRSFLLALREEGPRLTAERIWTRLFGTEEYVVFIRPLEAAAEPFTLPVEIKGATVRPMREEDIDTVARLMPFSLSRMPLAERRASLARGWRESAVAQCGERLVGAVWYLDSVGPNQPFYAVAKPYIREPARLTAGMFVIPGEKVGSWAMVNAASQRLAALGVRCTVSAVRAGNKASMIMSRMHNGTLVARVSIRYRFGRRTTHAEPASGRAEI